MDTIQVILMIYDCESVILKTLESYLPIADRFQIFIDNKSSDNTLKICREFQKNKFNVNIYRFEFEGFSNSRNYCLSKSTNSDYTWTMFVDDSYMLLGDSNALRKELTNCICDCISVTVGRDDVTYLSKRIIRTNSGIRYEGKIHETLNSNSGYNLKSIALYDMPSESGKQRSLDRVDYDLEQLEGLTDPRSLYYKACALTQNLLKDKIPIENVISAFKTRAYCSGCNFREERFMAFINIGNLYNLKIEKGEGNEMQNIKDAMYNYIKAAESFPNRAGEAYFFVYLLTDSNFYLNKAAAYPLGSHCLTSDENIYSKIKELIINQ